MNEPGKEFGLAAALTSGLVRLEGRLGYDAGIVGPRDMNEETDQHESDQEELVKQ